MTDFDLIERGNLAVAITRWRNKHRPELVVRRGTVIHTVGDCRDEMAARRLWWALKQITDTTGATR